MLDKYQNNNFSGLNNLYDEFLNDVKQIIADDSRPQARDADIFLDQFFLQNPNLAAQDKEKYDELKLLQRECQWIALGTSMPENKVFALFGNYLDVAWQIPEKYQYDNDPNNPFYWQKQIIVANLDKYIADIWLLDDQDKFKNKLQDVLTASEQIVSQLPLIEENKKIKPTLSAWFKLYFSEVGTGEVSKLKMAQFFNDNLNFRKLSVAEKEMLKLIFGIYEKLKLSSHTPEGNPVEVKIINEKGEEGYVVYGQFYPTRKYHERKSESDNITNQHNMINGVSTYKPSTEPLSVESDLYNQEDHSEIQKHQQVVIAKPTPFDYNKLLESLKDRFSLIFDESSSESRFDNIIMSYVRGLRDALEFKEMLTQPATSGGMDYKIKLAEDLQSIIDEEVFGKKNIPLPIKKAEIKPGVTPIIKSVITLPKKTEQPKSETKPAFDFQQAQQIIRKSVARNFAAQQKKAQEPKPIVEAVKKPEELKTAYSDQSQLIPQVRRLQTNKPIMQDIKKPVAQPRLIGPIEELATMDLVMFRRLADNPVEATEKIKEKIDLLQEQSFVEKAKGIAAFKKSPLNKIYLMLGNNSIEQGRSVAEMIEDYKKKGEKVLTMEEFDCIADLNKQLRF